MKPKTKTYPYFLNAITTSFCLMGVSAHGATINKANNTTDLFETASWVGNVKPGPSDIALWDSTVTAANSVSLAADTTYGGIKIANPGGAVTVTGAKTIYVAANGIDMSDATENLSLSMAGIQVAASQTWNIASGRTLTTTPNYTVVDNRTLTFSGSGTGNIQTIGWMQIGKNGSDGVVDHSSGTWAPLNTSTVAFIGHNGGGPTGTFGKGTYNLKGGTIELTGSQELRLGNQGPVADGNLIVTSGAINSTGTSTLLRLGNADGSKGGYTQSGGSVTIGTMDVASVGIVGAGTTGTSSVSAGSLSLTNLNVGRTNNGSFTLSGTGIFNLSGTATVGSAATSSGTLNLNGGTLNFTSTSAAITKNATGVVNVAGGKISNQSTGEVTVSAPMVLGSGGLTIAPSITNSRWVKLTGNLSGTGGLTVNITGNSTASIWGTNSFSGPIDVQSGYINSNSAGAIPTGVAMNLVGNWGMNFDATLSTLTGTGLIFGTPAALLTISVGHDNATSEFSGNIQGSGSGFGLTKIGSGTFTQKGSSNTYSGPTTVSAGTLKLGRINVIPDGADKGNVSVAGTLDVNGFSDTINGLSGAGTVDNTGATGATLTVGANDQTSSFSGTIKNTTGALAVTKTGTGTLTLSGVNTYSGNTTVSAGSLVLADDAGLKFVIGANGVNNKVTGSGTATLQGDFTLDLTGANQTVGNSWTLVDATSKSFSNTFTVVGFTQASDVWTKVEGSNKWTFTEATGILTLTANSGFASWAAANGLDGTPGKENGTTADPDGDSQSNLVEFAFGTNPLSSSSGPITYVAGGAVTSPGQPVAVNFAVGAGVDFRAVFGRRKDYVAAGLIYTVQFSAGLDQWVSATVTPTLVTGAGSAGEIDAVSVPYPLFIDTTNGVEKPTFFRVGVSQAP